MEMDICEMCDIRKDVHIYTFVVREDQHSHQSPKEWNDPIYLYILDSYILNIFPFPFLFVLFFELFSF